MRALIFSVLALMVTGCASANCNCDGKPDNPHLTLQLPPSFDCKVEGADHVCVTAKKDRYVIYTVKQKGKDDSIKGYQARFMESQLKEINGQMWVDATKTPGELPGYSTRYLATVENEIAALVTITGRTDDFEDFNDDMDDVISALVLRK